MGCEHMLPLVKALVTHFDYLASQQLSRLPVAPSSSVKYNLSVDEKPLLVVASSDLRQHPVGRFWLPIARKLRSIFKVVSVVGQPRDRDPIRDELRQLSDEWWPLEISGVEAMAERIRDCSPQLLIDLGVILPTIILFYCPGVWQLYRRPISTFTDPLMLNVVIGGLLIMFLNPI